MMESTTILGADPGSASVASVGSKSKASELLSSLLVEEDSTAANSSAANNATTTANDDDVVSSTAVNTMNGEATKKMPEAAAANGSLFGDDAGGDGEEEADADLFGSLDNDDKNNAAAAANKTANNDNNNDPLFGDDDDDDNDPQDAGTKILNGESSAQEVLPAVPAVTITNSTTATSHVSPSAGASSFMSKLSSSGLLENPSTDLFGEDGDGNNKNNNVESTPGNSGGAGGLMGEGGSSGLFDDIDAEEAAAAEEERLRQLKLAEEQAAQAAALAAQAEKLRLEEQQQLQQQQQQYHHQQGNNILNQSMENGIMHDLNLNDSTNDNPNINGSAVDMNDMNHGHDYGNLGMGMGLGGQIPREPQQQQYQGQYQQQQHQYQGHQQQQQFQGQYQQQQQQQYPGQYLHQQQQHQPQGVMNAMAGSYYYSTTGAGQMQGQPHPSAIGTNASNSGGAPSPVRNNNNYTNTAPQPSVLAGMHVGHDVNLGGVNSPNSNINNNTLGGMGSNPNANNNTNNGMNSVISNMSNNAKNIPPGQHHLATSKQLGTNTFHQPPSILADYVPPEPFDPLYGKIVVNDPMLIQGSGLFAGPPHWTYLVTVYSKQAHSPQSQQQSHPPQSQPISAVRRRFRHFVALEDRLRTSVPGAILPARPDKHPARAIEEATARQSSDFAMQRAQELGIYMNALAKHPHAGLSPELKLFLTLQDHIGTAWPEVSSSAFTRMTAVGTATLEKVSDTMDGVLSELGTAQQVAAGEDSADILALAAYEGRRIGAVSSSVPKIEGAVSLIRERGDRSGATGLEMSKLAKDVAWCDRELSQPMEVLSSALLRSGRRTKRLGLELSAAVAPFVSQYRMCRYEQMAFADRRSALKRRTEARSKADGRAAKLMMNQTSMQHMGRLGTLERMETEAAMMDEFATEAAREAEEVAMRLQSEVARIGVLRVKEWDSSMKVIASGMKEACAENAAIWESALEAFKREFPDLNITNGQSAMVGGNNSVS